PAQRRCRSVEKTQNEKRKPILRRRNSSEWQENIACAAKRGVKNWSQWSELNRRPAVTACKLDLSSAKHT
ncbi:uncharacterized protein METZ01_LOCUS392334, partial [marine metagenome]